MQNQKIFAFRLAIQQKSGNKPWQPRDGVAIFAPARSAGDSMPSRTTSDAPPEVVPATMRSASPFERA